jgi:ankyrin repeat protein
MPDSAADEKLYRAAGTGTLDEIRKLLAAGANPNAPSFRGDGYTPLIEAAFRGRIDAVRLLIEKKGDVNARSRAGWTALMSAAWEGHTEVVKLLLEKGADPGSKNGRGDTALSLAESAGNKDVVALLRKIHAERC